MSQDVSTSSAQAPTRNNHLWKWFFLVVTLQTLGAVASLWWFNMSIQLTPEELASQRQKWHALKPSAYYLAYLRVEDDSSSGFVYKVDVRGGEVERVEEFQVQVRERREVDPPEGEGKLLPTDEARRHSMDALFELATAIREDDARQERRVYVRARFHPENGAILEFVRRLMRSRERTQISVLAFRFGEDLER